MTIQSKAISKKDLEIRFLLRSQTHILHFFIYLNMSVKLSKFEKLLVFVKFFRNLGFLTWPLSEVITNISSDLVIVDLSNS